MAISVLSHRRTKVIGPTSNGTLMTPEEFDGADFEEGWRYELINGVFIVTPIPLLNKAAPNEELGTWLRIYRDQPARHWMPRLPSGTYVAVGPNRRRADRVIWAGFGRKPRRGETPTILVEFVSKRKRDYETKRDEYMKIGVQEYWVFDRFNRTSTVFARSRGKVRTRVFGEDKVYQTALLPGFDVSLQRLFALANEWDDNQPE